MGLPGTAAGQARATTSPGNVTLTAGFDFVSAYMFRGLRQDDSGIIMWPSVDARVDAGNASVHIGSWNSLNTGLAGFDGSSGRMWYESDFYTSFGYRFGGVSATSTYTAYTSPNSSFSTVKELSFRVAGDGVAPAGVTLNPYGLVAFELDTHPGLGQADGGLRRGTYLELGVAPGLNGSPVALAFPVKIGLSLDDYYELAGGDHRFGYLSLGAVATVPIGHATSYGAWNVHGGVEFQSLGDTPEAFNGGDQTKVIGSIGIGFSY